MRAAAIFLLTTTLASVGVVLAQSDTSINLVDFAFGLGLWRRLPTTSSVPPSGIVKAMSLCLQRISQSTVNGQDMVSLLQALKASTAVTDSVGPFEQDTVNLLVGERQRLMEGTTDDEIKQVDASNLDKQIDFFKDKPTITILRSSSDQPSNGSMDWQKWTAIYTKCVNLVKADSDAIDGVRIYLAGWLDVGGDPPQTDILSTAESITTSTTAQTTTTTTSSTSLESTADNGSPKPPDLNDLLAKMRQELIGSSKHSTNTGANSSDDEDEGNGSAFTSRANITVLIAGVAVVLAF